MRRIDPGADFDVQLTLELARVAREPSPADKQRVLESLQVQLGDMPSLPSAGESITGVRLVVPKLGRVSVAARATRFARSLLTSKAALHLLWVGAATGAIGFWLGTSVTQVGSGVRGSSPALHGTSRSAPSSLGVPASQAGLPALAAPATAPAAPDVLPPRGQPAEPPVAAVALPATSAAQVAAPSASIRPPSRATPARRVQNQPSAARGTEAAGASPPPAMDPSARFLEAVRLLSRAQRALDGGEPALALVLLGEMDERVPGELLGEERQAARIIALCKNGEGARASSLAVDFAARSPGSIYAARIARSCGGSMLPAAVLPAPALPAPALPAPALPAPTRATSATDTARTPPQSLNRK